MSEDSEKLLEEIRSNRGYTIPLHEVLAKEDPEVLSAYDNMLQNTYLKDRRLDGKTKELIYVGVLVSLGSEEGHIRAHMEKAVRHGATKHDVLEAIELTIAAAGVPRASIGFGIWQRTFGADA